MTTIELDFETRSAADLRDVGVYRYAQDPTTDIWCMSWAVDDAEPSLWKLGEPFPDVLASHIAAGAEMRAYNVQFERIMWRDVAMKKYGWPEVPLESWFCTMADACAMGLPRSLEQCATVLKLQQQKDQDGYQNMLRLSRPRARHPDGTIVWWDIPERLEKLYAYNRQDVRTQQAIRRATLRFSPSERAIYLEDQRINDRGILVDVPLARSALVIVDEGLERANREVAAVTGGAVSSVNQVGEITTWLKDAHGIDEGGVRKSIVRELLEGDLPTPARAVLEARAEAGRSSTAKIRTMLTVRCEDDRVRGLFLYHGAGPGRWSGKLVQPQNFPRPEIKDVEDLIPTVMAREYDVLDMLHPPLIVISSLLRGLLRASPGCRFLVGDFAQIEARVLAWLAHQWDLVKLFATGGKVYEEMAAAIYSIHHGRRITADEIKKGSPERQMGKDTILGCGYQMGAKTFRRQLKEKQGVEVDEGFSATAVEAYRAQWREIPAFWRKLNAGALSAVEHRGEKFTVHGCRFAVRGPYLWFALPSGRLLAYPAPRLVTQQAPWGEMVEAVQVWGVNSLTKRWEPYTLYGGLLTENAVQALARDLLAAAILRTARAGYPTVLHSHDEIVADVPNDHGSLDDFLALMKRAPKWAEDCPIEVEGWQGERYRK